MTTVLAEGLVGKPDRHPVTGIIIPHRKVFSDVTFPVSHIFYRNKLQ